jgi:hypothetical protein
LVSGFCDCEGKVRLTEIYSAPYEDSEPSHTDDWLEQEARFFCGPVWDEMRDSDKENAIGFMNVYALDLSVFGDADGDGLPDHPDWDPDYEDDGDFDFDPF